MSIVYAIIGMYHRRQIAWQPRTAWPRSISSRRRTEQATTTTTATTTATATAEIGNLVIGN